MPKYKFGAAIWGSIVGAGVGFLILVAVWIAFWVVTSFLKHSDPVIEANQPHTLETVWSLWPLAMILCAAVPWGLQALHYSTEKEGIRKRNEASERAKAQDRLEARKEAVREAATACQDSVNHWNLLPDDLENALSWVANAQQHFRAGAFSPFWESIEHGYQCLGTYLARLERINSHAVRYPGLQRKYTENDGEGALPAFPLDAQGITPSRTAIGVSRVLDQAVYEAQKVPVYAQIWEQRRNTAAVIEGFQTLSEAVSQMKNALSAQLGALENTLTRTASSMQSELRVSNERLAQVAASSSQQAAQAVLLNTQVANAGLRLRRIEKEIVGS